MANPNNNLAEVVNANLEPIGIRRQTHFQCVNCRLVPQEYGVRCGNCNGNLFYLGIDQSQVFTVEENDNNNL